MGEGVVRTSDMFSTHVPITGRRTRVGGGTIQKGLWNSHISWFGLRLS